jgi:hypothetical protein
MGRNFHLAGRTRRLGLAFSGRWVFGWRMPIEEQAIEVEVVEVDGVVVRDAGEREVRVDAGEAEWADWRGWQGQVRRLDGRWWPLWAVLGVVAVVLLLTVGLVVAALVLVVRLVVEVARGLAGLFRR